MSTDERVALLNENGAVIGYKMRSKLTDSDCWQTVCVWVENTSAQVLLQQRAFDRKINPGMWTNAVIGTVVGDDTEDETAIRETAEEIGLSGLDMTKANRLYYKAVFGWRWAQSYQIICDWPIEKFSIQKEEVAKLEWIDKRQLLKEITGQAPHSRPYPKVCSMWPELFNLV
jgi:isopentenyldiphosphate isomerase